MKQQSCVGLLQLLCSCMNTIESVTDQQMRGLCILRETFLNVIHLRQPGKLRGHEGLLSFSYKSKIIKEDIQGIKNG